MDSQAAAAHASENIVQADFVKRYEKRSFVAQRLIEKYEANMLDAPTVLLDLAARQDLSKRSWESAIFLARQRLQKQLSGDLSGNVATKAVHTSNVDDSLPAKAVFLAITDEGPFMCWGLNYLYDRLQKLGESRKFFKWCQFFQQTVTQTDLVGDNLPCVIHLRGHGLPPEALDESVASSEAVLTYFYAVLNVGRKPEIMQEVELWMRKLINRVCEEATTETVDVAVGDLGVLQFRPRQGIVNGLQELVMTRHSM
eukprot:s464_g39.t1